MAEKAKAHLKSLGVNIADADLSDFEARAYFAGGYLEQRHNGTPWTDIIGGAVKAC